MRVGQPVNAVPTDLARLLQYPNRNQTFSELRYLTCMHVKSTGNAFWFKSEPLANGTRPRELWPLNPKNMKIVPSNTAGVAGYVYSVNGKEIPLDVEEVLHFKRPHPDNEYWGLGDIEAGEQLFNDWVNRDGFQESFWKNGARPSGVLSSEATNIADEPHLRKLKAQWDAQYSGKSNAGKTAWIYGSWKYTQLGLNLKEMEAVETRKQNLTELFIQHGVPLSVAGIEGAANYATAEIDRVRFNENTVLPMVRLVEDTMNTDLMNGWGLEIDFQVSGLIAVGSVVANYVPIFDRGAMSINEMRELTGLQPDAANPLWNQHFIQAGLVPLDLAGFDTGLTEPAARGITQRQIENALKAPQHEQTEDKD
jgi:HK97 family phage portal protein